ncbi:MAG: chromosome segregation protein SMC [Methanocellales archaeon]|nr:chromosome segregation protein SMC [Methanocellales archaeon]
MGLALHIKDIDLRNFKSFGKRVKISFFDDFTTISGPNGSGKSNIIDAILFVLGLSSSKMMRAERLTDLIYNVNGKNPDHAEVTINFDNADREFPLDQDVVKVKRRIQRTEAGYYSNYYLNDRPCSLSELRTHLSKSKIFPEGYNVVVQGDITKTISMSAIERRKVIDEIAGVAEFDEKKERSLKELETVRERIDHAEILLSEVSSRLEQLAEEREQALKYQALRNEKHRYEAFTLLAKRESVNGKLKKVIKELQIQNSRKDGLVGEITDIRFRISKLEEKLGTLNEKIMMKGEDEQIKIKEEIMDLQGKITFCKNAIEFSQNEIEELEKERRRTFIEIDRTQHKIEGLTAQAGEEEVRKGSLLAEMSDKREALSLLQDKIAKVDAKFAGTRDNLVELKKQIEGKRDEKNELLRAKDRLLDEIRRNDAEVSGAEREISNSMERIYQTESEIRQIHEDLRELEMELKKRSDYKSDLESKKFNLKRELSEAENKLWNLQQEYAKTEARVKAAEETRYYHAVEKILSAKKDHMLSGIYGTIAELGKVDEKYALALEIAAGSKMQCIVVSTDEDASHAIEFLKMDGSGRATFLPLNKMRRPGLLKEVKEKGVIDYAINLVEYDPKFNAAFYYVFGDTLVVSDLDSARELMPRRMVTIEGDLIEKSGAMTGGTAPKSRFKFVATEENKLRELVEQITIYESKRQKCIEEMDAIESQISSTSRGTTDLDTEIAGKKRMLADREELKDRYNELIKIKEGEIGSISTARKRLGEEIASLELSIAEADDKISALGGKIEGLEAELTGSEIPSLANESDRIESEIRRLEDRAREIDVRMSVLHIERDFCASRVDEHKEKLSSLEERKGLLNTKIKENRDQIVGFEKDLKIGEDRKNELETELADLREIRDESLSEQVKAETEKGDVQRNIDLVDVKIESLESTREELQIQFNDIDREIISAGIQDVKDVPSSNSIKEKIVSLESEMTALEPVNMRAIEEYEQVQDRQQDLQKKRDVLSEERNELLNRIKQYEQMKKDTFMENFLAINAHFKDVFARLSDGEGELILENWEDPFAGGLSIKAEPSGKAIHHMEALSGGEKSLTALAFILAIQKHRPSPFYVFDEIDMYLDGSNAERVAKVIKDASKDGQFIVVSLRKPMIESADRTIGVTMQEDNVSSITGVMLN